MGLPIVPNPRYFLDTDSCGHWFVVPLAHKSEWEAWASLPDDDPANWDPPDFAKPVGGSPTLVIFENPEVA